MKKIAAYFALVIAISTWSISIVILEEVLGELSSVEVNVMRFTIAAIFLWMIQSFRRKKMAFASNDLLPIMFAGVVGTVGYYHFTNIAFAYVTPSVISITRGVTPFMTLVIAMLFMGKKTRFRNIFFLAMSFLGIFLLSNHGEIGMNMHFQGISLVILGNLGWVIYTLVNENLIKKYDKLGILTVQMSFGAIVMWFIYLYRLGNAQLAIVDFSKITENGQLMASLLFIGIFSSALSYYLYNYAMATLGATLSALSINLIPVVSFIIGVAIGVDYLSFQKIIGCVLVLLTVYLIDDI